MDYQPIIEVVAELFKQGMPIGMIFGISEWILYTFFSMAFPKRFAK